MNATMEDLLSQADLVMESSDAGAQGAAGAKDAWMFTSASGRKHAPQRRRRATNH